MAAWPPLPRTPLLLYTNQLFSETRNTGTPPSSFSAVTTSAKQAAFALVAGKSHFTLKTKIPYLVVPSKLLEVAKVVGNLVIQGLVEDQLMGPALEARLAELESDARLVVKFSSHDMVLIVIHVIYLPKTDIYRQVFFLAIQGNFIDLILLEIGS